MRLLLIRTAPVIHCRSISYPEKAQGEKGLKLSLIRPDTGSCSQLYQGWYQWVTLAIASRLIYYVGNG